MPKKTDTNGEESDDEQSDEQTLMTRAKLAILALWSCLRSRVGSAVERVRDELAQASDELAPQLRGALSGVSVPKRALKPLGLAAVLLFAAVALGPAAPLGGDTGPVDNGTEPVVGTTYEPVDDGEYRNVVTSRLGSLTSDAPPAPNEVRTSAGSQTMSVETTVRDGEPAIVLEDDRTHDGRWVAIETSWFDEHVGEVPEAAYIEHEDGGEYASPIETRGGEAAFYVQGFSTNTVTFSGEFTISATATDGDSLTYNATDGGDDLVINATGVDNTGTGKSLTRSFGPGLSDSFTVGGNTKPQNATVEIDEAEPSATGDEPVSETLRSGDQIVRTVNVTGELSHIDLNYDESAYSGGSYVEIRVAEGDVGSNVQSNYKEVENVGVDSTGSPARFDFSTIGGYTENQTLTIGITFGNHANDLPITSMDVVPGGDSLDLSGEIGSSSISTTSSTTESVSLSPGENNISLSGSGYANVNLNWQERTVTTDPIVELNGNTVSYDGTLNDGETVELAANDSWIAEGENTVTVSVGDGTLSAGSPTPQVALDYQHDVSKSRTIDYTGEAFSERYAVSESWNEDTENASLTIPWASDRVISLRSVSVEHRDGSGNVVQTIESPTYAFENGSVVVELGDVQSGWETTVSATGSKVQVDNADLTVLEPTDQGEDLNSTIRLGNPGDDVYLRVGGTEQGQQLHYLANTSWDATEASRISADGTNEIRIPNAPDNGETTLRTLPVAFDVNSGAVDVDVPEDRVNTAEPVYRIGPGEQVGDSYDVTFTEAADGQPYVLYDETDEIVLDQGLAESPLTLSATAPEKPHVIQFREDDGTASGSGDGGLGSVGGGAGPMVTNPRPFSALTGLIPGPGVIVALLGGGVGLAVLSRETDLFNEGTRSDAVADAAKSVGVRTGGLVERALSNEIVVALVMLGASAWLLSSGVFGATERLIVALGSVPVAMYLALRQFGTFDFRVWAGSTAVVAVLGVVVLAPDAFESLAREAGVIIVAGLILLGWRALSAWRAEANTPDEVNRIEISGDDGGD